MKFTPSPQSWRLLRNIVRAQPPATALRMAHPFLQSRRQFHVSSHLDRIETHFLSDIGEGVKEVQIIQWFVEEGAAVEEWAPLCEVQSDKASVEITSKYSGVIKKLHFPSDAIVQVGDGMVDIEVEGEAETSAEESHETSSPPEPAVESAASPAKEEVILETKEGKSSDNVSSGKYKSLATPAVRGLLKQHNLAIENIHGTGKDGRVMKEDIFKHLEAGGATSAPQPSISSTPELDSKQSETVQKLTPIQNAMFKSMTASLSIPHFLYSDTANITSLSSMRSRLNAARNPETTPKLSYLPFVIKAVSLSLNKYPLLNARLDTSTDPKKPQLIMRSNHNIGIAMDTPSGLIVPVIKFVNARSISSIAQELQRLSQLGQAGKLSNADLTGGTITVSNIGNIGGEVLGPVIVQGQLAIVGLGKIKRVPVFGASGAVEAADTVNLSWSADHRVVDGATMARMARLVQTYLEAPENMIVELS